MDTETIPAPPGAIKREVYASSDELFTEHEEYYPPSVRRRSGEKPPKRSWGSRRGYDSAPSFAKMPLKKIERMVRAAPAADRIRFVDQVTAWSGETDEKTAAGKRARKVYAAVMRGLLEKKERRGRPTLPENEKARPVRAKKTTEANTADCRKYRQTPEGKAAAARARDRYRAKKKLEAES